MGGLVSSVGNLLGGNSNNSGFTASSASIMQPTTAAQAGTAYTGVQNALTQQQALAQALQAQGTQGMSSQTALAQALQNQINGTGPNPAQAQLAQATAANNTNQASLMAGQRGSSANVGLIARQAAQLAQATQQNSVGQAATLGAQDILAAEQEQQQLAANQIAQQAGSTGAVTQAQLGEQNNILNSINAENNAAVSMQSNENSANAGLAETNANNTAGFIGGGLNAIGAGGAQNSFAKGGIVGKDPAPNKKLDKVPRKDRLLLPDHIKGMADIYHPDFSSKRVIKAAEGAVVPGKPKVNHDSYQNDVVDIKASPGEIVLPLHITQAKDAPEKAKEFVANELAEKLSKNGKGSEESDFKESLKKAIKARKK